MDGKIHPEYSCALDLADGGPQTHAVIAKAIGASPRVVAELIDSAMTSFIKAYGGSSAIESDLND